MSNPIARLLVWDGTRRRGGKPLLTPALVHVPYEAVTFASANRDAALLSGWMISPEARSAIGAVILCHGHRSTRSAMLWKALMLRRHHFTTLLFDFRARGYSQGERCTLGLREADDVLGAVAFLKSRSATADLPIVALGESMGGAAAILAASRCDAIRGVVAEASFASLEGALEHRARLFLGPAAPPVCAECRRIGREEMRFDIGDVCPADVIASLAPRPVLLIQDGLDLTCPARESEWLFAAAKEPKTRWFVPAAFHCTAFLVAPREYERRISRFCTEIALSAAPTPSVGTS